MKRYAIVTASDNNYGDFLAEHWYASLSANVDLSDTDVFILDYGITNAQKAKFPSEVNFISCTRDGHIVNLRYRDLISVCDLGYEQVLMCDGGDVIFQADISGLFEYEKDKIRGVVEYGVPFDSLYLHKFKKEIRSDIKRVVKGRGLINGGLILGPGELMSNTASSFLEIVNNLNSFGPDQLGITYLAYKSAFAELDKKYNFIISSFIDEGFYIKDGVFYFKKTHEVIPVIHNAGRYKWFRPIRNFGFGNGMNKMAPASVFMPMVLKVCAKFM